MAISFIASTNPMTVKAWARKLFVDAVSATWIDKFVGEGTDKVIQRLMPGDKGAGDQITFGLRMRLTGDGVQGDGTLEGNEEPLNLYNDSFVINQLRHAVRVGGENSMSQQRVLFNLRTEAKNGLTDWWAERLDYSAALQLTGTPLVYNPTTDTWSPSTDTRYTGNNAVITPDSQHWLYANAGAANEAALTNASTDYFTLALLDRAVARAKTIQPRVRPVRINGGNYYVAFLHPFHVYQLRQSAGNTQWADIEKAKLTGGQIESNSILTGALGIYNGVILHEWDKLPPGVAANGTALTNVRRSVLCGAQAGVLGFGTNTKGDPTDAFDWVEETFDYKNQLGVAAGGIFGLKKSRFNAKDFGTIVMSSYTPTPA